ncbi:tRNA pseudouridine38-40 synthase [Salirhabdus euzebyi]|uniref:tRNA pseudouridine synthase A n=1 Tax=Salirhabdus euzebyi TaxID=394506 RepID=A0A841QA40_9BACI|nr:tRNA pseudouridine(38-40) synthase TruA [Salirhabdus euzebyi]MBB6455154.1 tRNA pseudouridine38-40 synthase [Salirhabdus euzebyi]
MQRVKCTIRYDGTNFYGFQVQPNKRTVQLEVENALQKMHNELIRIIPSGRTDTGVHAVGQVIHFDSPLTIDEKGWKKALTSLLPSDIQIVDVKKVEDSFHARYDVQQKEYRYRIHNFSERDIFRRNYVCYVPELLHIDKMEEACTYLKGTHDFTSFSSAKSTVKGDKIRTLYDVRCLKEGNDIVIRVVGSGFLYNMVRIIAGTLIEIGKGKRLPEDIQPIIEGKDRSLAGKTAPPQGLYLWHVSYNEDFTNIKYK